MLVRTCLICSQPMTPYEPAMYPDSGAVVHVRREADAVVTIERQRIDKL